MKPRDKSRRAYARVFALCLQRWRLEHIARGELEPICIREEFFLRTLREHGRARIDDFIVPHPLLMLEALRELRDPAPEQPFTPSPETAISPG